MDVRKSIKDDFYPPVTYAPKYQENNQEKFRRYIEKTYNVKLDNYEDFHTWSVKNYPEFWEGLWTFSNIIHSKSYTKVADRSKSFGEVEWFKDARLNYAENILKYRDDHLALILLDEEDNVDKVTYAQMYDEVARYAAAMRKLGIKTGDRVACSMSNRKEAIYAFLATTSIGAIWSGALPSMGAKVIVSRFELIAPKILFTVDQFRFNKEVEDMIPKLREISKGLPSLEKIVIVPSKESSLKKDLSLIPKSCFLPNFLKMGSTSEDTVPLLRFEQLPFDHPLMISYTSGTTGKPKGLIHSIGAILATVRDFWIHQNCTRDDILFSVSPAGWITWTLHANCLVTGLTLCLYEGYPYNQSHNYLWNLMEKHGITLLFIASGALDELYKTGHKPGPDCDLRTLRTIYAAGSPVKPYCYDFVSKDVMPNIYFASLYGSTELLGYASGVNLNMPVYRGEIQSFALGVDIRCVDAKGNYVVGERGNLVIGTPMPSFPISLYDDENGEKYRSSYLLKYPGLWNQNDECWINPVTKGFKVFGRSDETLNPKGKRFSCMEIYTIVETFPEVEDCLCVSQYNSEGDERAILFLKMMKRNHFTSLLEEKIRESITKELSAQHVPEVILETPEIPYSVTKKKMELLVKKLVNNLPVSNRDVVKNPASLDFYMNLPQLQDF